MTEHVFVVDWDGTLVEDAWPEQGNWLPGAVDAMRRLLDYGRVKVFSARLNPYLYGHDGEFLRPLSEIEQDIEVVRRMLDEADLDAVEIHTTAGKPSGTYYIDNQAIEFRGDWNEVLDRVVPSLHNPAEIPTIGAVIRVFDSGATRDTNEDKLAYEGFFSPLVLEERARYMHKHRIQSDGNLRSPDNWQKGIPLDAYIDSGWRHFMDWWLNHRGYESRESLKEALCALAFNVDGYLHEILKQEKTPDHKGQGSAREATGR